MPLEKPTQLPEWATNGANIVEPNAGRKAAGWLAAIAPPAGNFNWWKNLVWRWIAWFADERDIKLRTCRLAAANAQELAFGFTTGSLLCGGPINNGLTGGGDPVRRVLFAGTNGSIVTLEPLGADGPAERTAASSYTGTFRGYTWNQNTLGVLVGDDGEIQTSAAGAIWTHRTPAASYAGDFYAVVWSDVLELFCAVGSGGEIQTSPDGTTWTHRTAAASYTGTFRDVLWSTGLGLFVAVGDAGEIQTSPDGTTWTHRTSGTSEDIHKIVSNGAAASADVELMALLDDDDLLTSEDAASWFTYVMLDDVVVTSSAARALLYFNGIWHIFGADGLAAVSPDRSTWTTVEVARTATTSTGAPEFNVVVAPPLRSPRWFAAGPSTDYYRSLGV